VEKMESYIIAVCCAKFFFTRRARGAGAAAIIPSGLDLIKTIAKVATKNHG